jgi:hypothetical protein
VEFYMSFVRNRKNNFRHCKKNNRSKMAQKKTVILIHYFFGDAL